MENRKRNVQIIVRVTDNLFNDFYARDMSKKICAVMRAKGNSGEHLCTNPPYECKKDPQDKKKWIVDEEAAAR